jgi:hypothetical protein
MLAFLAMCVGPVIAKHWLFLTFFILSNRVVNKFSWHSALGHLLVISIEFEENMCPRPFPVPDDVYVRLLAHVKNEQLDLGSS